MSFIKRFIDINRRLSQGVAKRWPRLSTGGDYYGEMLKNLECFIGTRKLCRVLEAGGIDRPLLKKSSAFTYTGLDIEYREKCRQIYDDFIVQSIEDRPPGNYDLICSFTLLEHVRNNRLAFNAMYDALTQGGMMVHYVPGGWHPYALVIRLLGPRLSVKILHRLYPEVIGQSGYPAYFDYCTVGKMRRLCSEAGFKNITFSCYYRANFYFEVFFPTFLIVTLWEDFCRLLGLKAFCSGFIVTARKEN